MFSQPRLRSIDSADRALRFRAFFWPVAACLPLAVAVIYYLNDSRPLTRLEIVAILLLAVAIGLGLGALVWFGSGMASRGLVQVITGSGNLKPAPSFSFEESLVARGRADEAAASFRDHLRDHPDDHSARLALAEVLAVHLADPVEAERLYLEVRRNSPSPGEERVVAESLIALYRRTGHRGREMAELARFADQYRGTAEAAAAREAVLRLKQEIASLRSR